ncbi:MAG TPA: glycosyltransferase family 4 protein [Bryobacteraceae bacterium]|nr:glycosyltransferase family 4 protein [Bryobacteraceae bacterium]
MRIGLITNYYPPEVGSNSYLYQSLAHYLGARGHKVFVITGQPRYHVPDGSAEPAAVTQEVCNVTVLRAKVLHILSGGIPARVVNEAALPLAFLRQVRQALPLDVICMYSPPLTLGLLGIAARALWRVPFVFNVQDMLPQAAVDMGALRNPVLIAALRGIERQIYRCAAAVLVHSEGNRQMIHRFHSTLRTRIQPVYNWVDFDQFDSLMPLPSQVAAFIEGKTVFSYGGALGLQHDISTILEAANRLRHKEDIVFVIAGDGVRRDQWSEMVRSRNLARVRVEPLMPQRQFNSLLLRSRASFLALSPMLKTPVVPGKLQTIMAAGVPALCVVNPESDAVQMVEKAGCGYCVKPGQVEELTRYIEVLAARPSEAEQMGARGRAFARKYFAKENCMAAFEQELLLAAGRACGEGAPALAAETENA